MINPHFGRPSRAAIGRAREPDAGFADRADVGTGLVSWGCAAGVAGQISPRGVNIILERCFVCA